VLDWLKLAPDVDAAALRALERQLRQDGVRDWLEAAARTAGQPLTARVEALRAALQAPRPLPDWLAALREALTACGAWQPLLDDAAGAAVAEALSLAPGADTDWLAWPAARRRLGLREFTRWVGETLEAASFRPRMRPVRRWSCCPSASCSAALGRPGAARRRRAAPARRARAARPWTAAQRQALHLPLRGAGRRAGRGLARGAGRAAARRAVAHQRRQRRAAAALALGAGAAAAGQGRPPPTRAPAACWPPGCAGARAQRARRPQPLSASSYEMLRACPYRFFALRQLGLAEEGELEAEVDKRDFGIWLHQVLHRFHQALQADPAAARPALLDAAAEQATHALGLQGGAFLPFAVAWPSVRDGYLDWLAGHEAATGAVFEQGSSACAARWVALHGTLDRVDRLPDGAPLVIDYKTESAARTGAPEGRQRGHATGLLRPAGRPRRAAGRAERGRARTCQVVRAQATAGARRALHRHRGRPGPHRRATRCARWARAACATAARGLCRKDFWS
jgi:ATP-dependent helicase/nuclease subunit B